MRWPEPSVGSGGRTVETLFERGPFGKPFGVLRTGGTQSPRSTRPHDYDDVPDTDALSPSILGAFGTRSGRKDRNRLTRAEKHRHGSPLLASENVTDRR
jgi:hypothetical protein